MSGHGSDDPEFVQIEISRGYLKVASGARLATLPGEFVEKFARFAIYRDDIRAWDDGELMSSKERDALFAWLTTHKVRLDDAPARPH
jgi:hypothetical protein